MRLMQRGRRLAVLQRDEGEGWSGYNMEASEAESEPPSAAHTG